MIPTIFLFCLIIIANYKLREADYVRLNFVFHGSLTRNISLRRFCRLRGFQKMN